jgi:hypothetical protein
MVMNLAAQNWWLIKHLNVKPTFQNGNVNEEVIMELLERLPCEGNSSKVYKLMKAVYELIEVGCAN